MNIAKRLLQKTKRETAPPRSEKIQQNDSEQKEPVETGVDESGRPPEKKTPQAIGKENWHISVSRDRLTAFLDYVPKPDKSTPAAAER